MKKLSPGDLYQFLKKRFVNASFIEKLKIVYRPFICPFHDLLENIIVKDKVFDIGCGSGQFALLIAEFSQAQKVKGIDLLPSVIKNADQLLKPYSDKINFEFELYDGKQIPADIIDYNKIFMIDVFHHIPKLQQKEFLNQLSKKLKKDTYFIFKDIDRSHPLAFMNKIHDFIFAGEIGNEISCKKFGELAEEVGFEVKNLQKKRMFFYPHFTYVLLKK